MKIICGIYKIEDIKTGNVYVGHADDIKKRWSNHNSKIKGNYHEYKELQEAYNLDSNRIAYEILEECSEEELSDLEDYYMDYCGKVDGWTVINKDKDRTKRKSKVKDTSKMKAAQTGTRNGNCSLLDDETASEILWLKENSKLKHSEIAEKYNVRVSYIARVGKDRWKHVKALKPDWIEEKGHYCG